MLVQQQKKVSVLRVILLFNQTKKKRSILCCILLLFFFLLLLIWRQCSSSSRPFRSPSLKTHPVHGPHLQRSISQACDSGAQAKSTPTAGSCRLERVKNSTFNCLVNEHVYLKKKRILLMLQ